MCYDLSEYDPFEPLYIWDGGDGEYIDSEPMSDYDWEEWLSTMENENVDSTNCT